MKLHPLLNQKSPHYGCDKQAKIYAFNEEYTKDEILSWCKLNAEKYKERKGKKEGESEQDNIEKYESFYYTALLFECDIEFDDIFTDKIITGDVTKNELVAKLQELREKAVHSISEKILLDILIYMEKY